MGHYKGTQVQDYYVRPLLDLTLVLLLLLVLVLLVVKFKEIQQLTARWVLLLSLRHLYLRQTRLLHLLLQDPLSLARLCVYMAKLAWYGRRYGSRLTRTQQES
jgi:hypothetical protein